jgi:hypothetical protein
MKLYKAITIALLSFSTLNTFAQKAYNQVIYKGKVGQRTIKLNYADGYLAGCTIRVTDKPSGKKAQYLPSEGDADYKHQLDFYKSNKGNPAQTAADHIRLNGIDSASPAPKRISGSYYLAGKVYVFSLRRG